MSLLSVWLSGKSKFASKTPCKPCHEALILYGNYSEEVKKANSTF